MLENAVWAITEEDYVVAESNGISREQVYKRVYKGKKIQDAITEPVRVSCGKGESLWLALKDKSEVSHTTFYRNIKDGLPPEEAIKKTNFRKCPTYGRIPEWVFEQAATLGVPRSAVYQRVNMSGWTYERAATEPVMPRTERVRRRGKLRGGLR